MARRAHRRIRAAGVAALAAATLAPGLAGCTQPPDPEPQFSFDDALPSELVAGRTYQARVTVTFPADWPESDETGRSAMVGLAVDLGTGAGPLICDSRGLVPEDLPTVTLTCDVTPQVPTLGVQVAVQASTADAYTLDGELQGLAAEHVYLHTVAP